MDPDNKIRAWRWRQLAVRTGAGWRFRALRALLDGLLSRVGELASLIPLMTASQGSATFLCMW